MEKIQNFTTDVEDNKGAQNLHLYACLISCMFMHVYSY